MPFKHTRGAIMFPVSAFRAPKIPLQLAVALLNDSQKPVKAQIHVFEENMQPTVSLRSQIIVEQLHDPENIEPGEIYYIIDHNLRGFLRRVSLDRNEDLLRLSSDHPDKSRWPAHYMRITSIRAIFRIVK